MGLDVWQTTRCDRSAGSPTLSETNNDPVDSLNRMQTVRVVYRSPDRSGGLYHAPEGHANFYQTVAFMLRCMLRLGSRDVSNMIQVFAKHGVN